MENEFDYAVLMADLVASRELEERGRVQRDLQKILDELNSSYEASLRAELAIVSGDQVQGLFPRPGWEQAGRRAAAVAMIEVILALALRLAPARFHFGVGCGALSTDLHRKAVAAADGSCFHRARHALDQAKKQGMFLVAHGGSRGAGETAASDDDRALSGSCSLLGSILEGWTDKQIAYVMGYHRSGFLYVMPNDAEVYIKKDVTQKVLATLHQVSPSVVSESLKAAQLPAFQYGVFAAAVHLGRWADRLAGSGPGGS